MKRIQVAAVTAVLALGGASFCHGQDAGRDAAVMKHEELVKRLSGEASAGAPAGGDVAAAYAEVLPKLLEKPDASDIALERIAFRASRPGAEAERAALSKVLA